ncbi:MULTISPECIES: hypothetical protein [unclassified Bacteroides]|uniref:hypothetical protein n=1 Tax=unclassified Bacteroides TaxID=2646097 RepID=UPI000E89E534|nr:MULTISPECIES: hypothetical protein [unclassified Bacteroides]RGN53194.1 hypothetical protein DXB58_25765 [Bacteroides sp. OM05-10AA]RGQ57000.1 hypothetical protein DWY87_26250 [Bacteroides sp. AF27-33]
MNSYQLISKLRKIRNDTYLTAIDQALYYELIAICNEKGWKDVFEARSSVLCTSLNIWDKTLRKSRKILADAGLISFESCRDKRVGCYYSFQTNLSNDMKSSVISSVNGTDENTDDKNTTPVISSVNGTDEIGISPIIDIKTINKEESLVRAHENTPPEKPKKSKKKEGDEKPLVYPFSSIAFMSAWEKLRQTPKWKKKLNYALQLSLDKLSKFEEEFAIRQIERAIESNWTGVVFTGTERDYQEWLNLKHGNNRKSDQSSECAVKVRTVKL